MMAFVQRMSGVGRGETTFGTFDQPLTTDNDIILEMGLVQPEANTQEGLRDADGTVSRGQTFTQDITAGIEARTYIMEPVDATLATGKIEGAWLFESGGMRQTTWDDGGTDKLAFIFDGQVNCQTASVTAVNLGCGTATSGYGWDLRGIRTALEIVAEVSGGIITVNCPMTAAIQEHTQSKEAVLGAKAAPVNTLGKEQFQGSLVFDGVATPVNNFTISLNPSNKAKKDPAAVGGVSLNASTDYDQMVSMTVDEGTATSAWWTNLLASKVVPEWKYTGTYANLILTDLSIRNHSVEDSEGEVALTQELSFKTLEIQYK